MAALSRPLSDDEVSILTLIQRHYGAWNTADEAFLSDEGDAVIFVKDASGESPICVNLTVCASASREGWLSLQELKSDWLRIPENP